MSGDLGATPYDATPYFSMTRGGGYSTEHGRLCPACGEPLARCACRSARSSGGDGIVRVGRETQGRKGAGVTVITGLALGENELRALASELKRRCGTGGTARDGRIELQGDHRDAVVAALAGRFVVKRSGG